ncbi:TM252 protein, partial [Formicarius rufipectus]|nr:TM252 protein [Formicarius rufipectus]
VLLLSLSTICLGVLCITTNTFMCRCGNNDLVSYCLIALGLFLLATGIFWTTFHEVLKYKALGILIRNPSHRELRVHTVDRPHFYPPSYEDCTDPEKLTFPLSVASTLKQQGVINIPPPPYSESNADFVSETNEQEQPPPYELCVWQLWQQQTTDQDSNPRVESNSHISMEEISY